MDTDHVILSAILPETIAGRAADKSDRTVYEEDEEE